MASTFKIVQDGKKETVNFDFHLITNGLEVTNIENITLDDIENTTVDIENARLIFHCTNAWVKENTIRISIKMTNLISVVSNTMELELLVYDHIITLPIDLTPTNMECTTNISKNELRYDNICLKEQWGDTAYISYKIVFAPKGNPNMTCTLIVNAEYDIHTTSV